MKAMFPWAERILAGAPPAKATRSLSLLLGLAAPFLLAQRALAQTAAIDFGDAPAPYPTSLKDNGPRHSLINTLFLGARVDGEGDGVPSVGATSDDLNSRLDDEDGVVFTTHPLIPGQSALVTVTVNRGDAQLQGWIDFDGNGSWADAGEQIIVNRVVGAGTFQIFYNVPANAKPGTTYARFRLSGTGNLSFTGPAGAVVDGEVEDYQVTIDTPFFDFGDAQEKYPVLASQDGARHVRNPDVFLGSFIDVEANGQPSVGADADDLASPNGDDEDGVTFLSSLQAGSTATVQVRGSTSGRLDAWVDFNGNASWDDVGEQIVVSQSLTGGGTADTLNFAVPSNATIGTTYARFRFSLKGGLKSTGLADDGEVEDYRVAVVGKPVDFGDAAQSYPVLLSQDGARHDVNPDVFLGKFIDSEPDGQPSTGADGDDLGLQRADDEDGVTFTSSLVAGSTAFVQVTSSTKGRLDAWIDFDGNSAWEDPGDRIFTSQAIDGGGVPNSLSFAVPASAKLGATYARFRFSLQGGLKSTGPATDGEVEDYRVTIEAQPIDFGDAPQAYPVLLSQDGARHIYNPDVFLGRLIDVEADGQPSTRADADDRTGAADEDGVVFASALEPGSIATLQVTASTTGHLDAWIDFDGDSDWGDPHDQIFAAKQISGGGTPNVLTFAVPATAKLGATYARFRFSLKGGLGPIGLADDGEVEDYQLSVTSRPTDYGDAPQNYPVLLSQDGARHIRNPDVFLGRSIDAEADGQPSSIAGGDDLAPAGSDDEDGVVFTSALQAGASAQVQVTASTKGALDAWIDFNGNGSWDDLGEQVFVSAAVNGGVNNLSFNVPTGAVQGSTFARFRYSLQGGLKTTGLAPNGEVEDYLVRVEGQTLDYGDAPENYPVTLSQDGARHIVNREFMLGKVIDTELDGQPSGPALGDDQNPTTADDEDGIRFTALPLTAGKSSSVEITVSGHGGFIDAWIDFNRNGTWDDLGEQIYNFQQVGPGLNTLNFIVPSGALPGSTYARFRLSSKGGLKPIGLAQDGEVEDYLVEVIGATLDFGDAPQSYPVLLTQNGGRHLVDGKIFLGRLVDKELDGQPSINADGDDNNPPATTALLDDEDGVRFLANPLQAGRLAPVEVVSSTGGVRLDAWIDFNGNGVWEPSEQIFTSIPLAQGTNNLSFAVPADSRIALSYSRFRVSSKGGLQPGGLAEDGEVEDHAILISAQNLDYGDAPESYPTLLSQDGARHRLLRTFNLGRLIDVETDGQPSAASDGDDNNPPSGTTSLDDEDGVRFLNPVQPGQSVGVEVTVAGGPGFIDAWIDFNRDGDWDDAGERIFSSQPVVVGANNLSFLASTAAKTGRTYSRWRLSTKGGLDYKGLAADGEVEDHIVSISDREVPCDPRTNKGTDFWLTFPGNYAPDKDNPVRLSLCIVGPVQTTVKVEIPGLNHSQTVIIPADGEITVVLPKEAELGNANDIVEKKGIHVTATAQVAVFGLNKVRWTSDGYLGLPSDVVGRNYIIQGYGNEFTGIPDLNGTQFAIVATADNTRVGILPKVSTLGHPAGVAYLITLNQGETYQLRNTNNFANDLTGTIIAADRNISVFGSHQCANIPDNGEFFCDHVVEQLLPLERAGSTFFSLPLRTRSEDIFRFTAISDNTQISVNGAVVATINAGQTHERAIGVAARITSTSPMFAAQYATSSDHDHVVNADPFMTVLPHVNMWLNNYMICTPATTFGFVSNWVNVVVPSAVVAGVTMDGALVPAAFFSPIGASGFSGARLAVTAGMHQFSAAQSFGLIVYGWNEYESYGYPGGMFFGDTTPPTLVCPDKITVVLQPSLSSVGFICTATIPDLRDKVQISDNCGLPPRPLVGQQPPPGTVVGPGVHIITVSALDAQGNVGSCETIFEVIDPGPIQLVCPQNMIVPCTSPAGARVNFEVIAQGRCGPMEGVEVVSTPASGSIFPPGETTVVSTATDAQGKSYTCTFKVTVTCGTGNVPNLTVSNAPEGNAVVLTWPGNALLERAPTVLGPWTSLSNANSGVVVQPTGDKAFFRLRSRN